MSNISKRREGSRAKIKTMGDHKEFLKRITKTLYYGQLPSLPCLSLPVTEISCSVWSEWQRGRSVRRLHADAAAGISRGACVSPAALVLALLYLERLRRANPDYLAHTPPAELFLVSLMVGNKFLQDDGEDEEVICSEWAASGGLELGQLKRLELDFLGAIDWNVFVSENSFERGLQWLERRVALRQAQVRGFFTYSDLAAAADAAVLAAELRALATAALACLAALATLLASALALPAHSAHPTHPTHPTTLHIPANIIMHSFLPPLTLTQYVPNSTLAWPPREGQEPACCTSWLRYRERSAPRARRDDLEFLEPWWSRTSLLAWLHRGSLVDPLRRWLDRIDEYAELTRRGMHMLSSSSVDHCRPNVEESGPERPRCVRRRLNLSKLGAFMVSVSDR